jgi:hypothetical protein
MHVQARAISLQPDAPMSMVGTDGTPVVEWSAFANDLQPASVDSELYRDWYAMAWAEYHEALALLESSTLHAAHYGRSSARDDAPLWFGLMQSAVDQMTIHVEDMRATALHIMCSRHKAETKEIMQGNVLNNLALASITESTGSQLGGALADGVVLLRPEE